MSWETAAMIEPLANAVHAWRLAGEPTGGRVGVIGAGTIGLVSLLVAGQAGNDNEVVVVDLAADRLGAATKLGASATATALEGEFDVIIDAVGAPATHQASLQHLKPGGTTVWVGLLSADSAFDATDLIRQEKRVVGSFAYDDPDFVAAMALAPSVDLSWHETFALDDGADIFTQLMHGRSDVIKALLRP
jgi:alcohol dehydrogenase